MTLVRAYLQFVPGGLRKLIGVVVLSVAGALANGLSIGLLLPALQMVERGARSGGGRWLDLLQQFYAGIGLPMSLLTLLAGALAMILIGQALIYAQVHLATWMSEELVAVLRRYAFERLLKADMEFHQRIRRGTLLNGLMQDLQRTASGFDSLLQALSHAILLGIYVALLVFVSWQLSLAGLALVVVASLLIQFQIRSSHRYGQALVAAFNQLNGFILERTEGIRLVKLGNAMARDHARFVELADRAAKLRAAQGRRGGQIRLLMEPAIAAGGIVSIYIGQVVFGMSLAELAVFLYILVRIVPEAYSLNRSRFNVAGFVSHYTSFRRLLAQAEQATTIVSGPTPFTGVRDGIRFTDVAFAYRQGEPVISRLNLTIDAGKFTAIVGPSGIGKSTLLDLVVRLLEPVRGRIAVDGMDLAAFDLDSLRRGIALVTQDVILFNDTIRANICYGWPEATEADIVRAAEAANAHSFIRQTPQGYETLVGPRGATLSGGERQRLALARALIKSPHVLLLDEVTSGLDAESERLIQESVFHAAEGRTLVVVTHRLSTIRRADKVIVLSREGVVEEGTAEELIGRDGLFRRYHELQLVGEGGRA